MAGPDQTQARGSGRVSARYPSMPVEHRSASLLPDMPCHWMASFLSRKAARGLARRLTDSEMRVLPRVISATGRPVGGRRKGRAGGQEDGGPSRGVRVFPRMTSLRAAINVTSKMNARFIHPTSRMNVPCIHSRCRSPPPGIDAIIKYE
jgi:hypothetical protein